MIKISHVFLLATLIVPYAQLSVLCKSTDNDIAVSKVQKIQHLIYPTKKSKAIKGIVNDIKATEETEATDENKTVKLRPAINVKELLKNKESAKTIAPPKPKAALKTTEPAKVKESPLAPEGPKVFRDEELKFDQSLEKYFERTFTRHPNLATNLGIHKYDKLAPNFSSIEISSEILELDQFLKRFNEINAGYLTQQSRIDRKLITSQIKARLVDLWQIRQWERNPDLYSSESSSIIYSLLRPGMASTQERLEAVLAREKRIPAILSCGKANVVNPPRIYTEIALEQMPGIISFFEKTLPDKFKLVENQSLKTDFQSTNQNAIKSLKDYQKYLKEKLLPKSNGNFALGAEFYKKKLSFEEMVQTPIDELLVTGEAELKRLQNEFQATAKIIDPDKSSKDIYQTISLDHPAPNELINATAAVLKQLKDFCREKNLVTIPTQDNMRVAETPPFKRALSFASMYTSGPFEEKTKNAYYYVTLPESNWTAERTEEHMRTYCQYDLLNTSVHEAYPGHYVQGLWLHKAPSKTSKIIGCASNSEGWAHYCEQMMVEQGLKNQDKKLKLIMLHDALLRCCRYIVSIKLHCKKMTYEQAVDFFINEGYQEKTNAEREAKRGAMNPTYIAYTLGKMQILSLLDDYRKLKGTGFSLKDFHDRFLAQGNIPINLIRGVLLNPADTPKKQ